MKHKLSTDIKVGIFIGLGILVSMVFIVMLGGIEKTLGSYYKLKVVFQDVSGLTRGSAIKAGGVDIGYVNNITFNEDFTKIIVVLKIQEKFKQRIKTDSLVSIRTKGMLGDKYADILAGSSESPIAKEGEYLEPETGKGLGALLNNSQDAMDLLKQNLNNIKKITDSFIENNANEKLFKNLAEATSNLKMATKELNDGKGIKSLNSTLKNLKDISDKINKGEGTIGALLTDETLYEDLKLLVGGAGRNKVLKFFVRQAVKTSDDIKKDKQSIDETAKTKQ